jgi:acetyl-CoA carboxylase beta subunit
LDESDGRREDQWFRKNEKELLEAARIAREKREAERASQHQAAALEALRSQHFMKCPKCGHDMKEEELGDVTIDRCSFCEGIYFDAGELERAYLKKDEDRRGLFRRVLRI